ncbi:hypothetical protein K503DRAFT_387978 [Rhizopogon vinicolor AM-OR11-026]|uniref:Uncharacterized protein n=1 Tax=Rhizopogon vinicolor AM-OR11-026 TaxID=1314800 RepID=A0A1B7NBI2_9AGAM|nr:hypothetical protein K503DRAFT_387978 [Rhizopogon vinicolor AM-OR11-026]
MNPPSSVACLSLTPNLRCVPLNHIQFDVLIIPPVIELIFCAFLIFLKWGSHRAHLLLAADGIFYFILALVDLLSHVTPAARNSITIFKAMDIFIGSLSFVPMLLYTSYLLWLSYREFITNLPHRHQSVPKYLLIILIPVVVVANEVASFVGVSIRFLPDSQLSLLIDFTNDSESLWLSLSQLSLALYTIFQLLLFLLAFYRLVEAFLDRQRIQTTVADEHHYFNGIGWITAGIKLGAIESIVGFATGSFAVPLSRRILRLIARSSLIIGVVKGMDARENFEYLDDELVSWRRSRHFSGFYSFISNQRMSRRASPYPSHQSPLIEKVAKGNTANQRVTVHYKSGQAPFLQIRFSAINFPEQVVIADGSGVQSRRRSTPEMYDNFAQVYFDQNTSAEIPAPHNAARSFKGNAARDSDNSDNMSVVRELALRFPLPPRITGKYRGSILGQKYENDDDEFPLVGISRESSMRRDTAQPYKEGVPAGNAALSTSGSIKRKPAPPLLPIPQPAHRRPSSWGGLASQNQSPATPTWTRPSFDSPSTNVGDDSRGTPRRHLRQLTPRQLFDRTSKALSVVSIRSAEWLSSARSQQSSDPQPTPARIEAYYNGGTIISPRRISADPGDTVASRSGEELSRDDRHIYYTDDAALAGTSEPQMITRTSIGQGSTWPTPTSTLAHFRLGREPIASTYGELQGFNPCVDKPPGLNYET